MTKMNNPSDLKKDLEFLANLVSLDFPGISVPNAFEESFLSEERLLNVLRNIDPEDFKNGLLLRVYLNSVLSSDQNVRLIKNRPLPDDSFKSWSERLFGEQEFFIILNGCEHIFHHLAEDIYKQYVRHIPKSIRDENTFKGVEIAILIGKYQNTPLPIHNDPDQLSILHLQIVGSKKLSFFNLLNDPIPSRELSVISGGAITYGGNHYHRGHAPELSVSVTLGTTRFGFSDLYKALNSRILTNLLIKQSRSLPGIIFPSEDQINGELEKLGQSSYSLQMKEAMEEYKLSLESNLDFVVPGRVLSGKIAENLNKASLRLRLPHKIVFIRRGDFLKIYVRKNQIELLSNNSLLTLLTKLNNYDSVPVDMVASRMPFFNLLCGLGVCDFSD